MRTAYLGGAIVGLMLQHGLTPEAWAQSDGPPPQCQQLLKMREQVQKHGQAINNANKHKADVRLACRLFRTYLAAEANMLKALDTDGAGCGVPAEINQQVKASHAKASQIGVQVCEAAGFGTRGRLLQGDFWTPEELERLQGPMLFE